MCHRTITSLDLQRLRQGLRNIQVLKKQLMKIHPEWIEGFQDTTLIEEQLESILLDPPGELGQGNQVFCETYDRELTQFNQWAQKGESEVEALVDKIKVETGITSLKVRSHKTFGLMFEVTKSYLHQIPKGFIRKQTMVGGERFVTEELETIKKLEDQRKTKPLKENPLFFCNCARNTNILPW